MKYLSSLNSVGESCTGWPERHTSWLSSSSSRSANFSRGVGSAPSPRVRRSTARIRAVLRRTRGDGAEPTPRLKFADLELDEDSHEVWRASPPIQLSPTAFKLLRYFMSNANRVLSKMQILDHVWDYDFRGDTGIVESYVSVLRRKVDSTEPRLIHTLRGVGYVLRLPSS